MCNEQPVLSRRLEIEGASIGYTRNPTASRIDVAAKGQRDRLTPDALNYTVCG